jgi:hypothetical protein
MCNALATLGLTAALTSAAWEIATVGWRIKSTVPWAGFIAWGGLRDVGAGTGKTFLWFRKKRSAKLSSTP